MSVDVGKKYLLFLKSSLMENTLEDILIPRDILKT